MEYLMQTDIIRYEASTLETIDTGLYEWVNEFLDIHTQTNKGMFKVPVLWLGTERVYQIKNDQRIRDKVGKLILPLMTINRDSVDKDPSFRGSFQANIKEANDYRGGATKRSRKINQEKTRNFQNSIANIATNQEQTTGKIKDNNQIVYDNYNAPIPVYVSIMYTVTLRTEYQQQMNDLLQPFVTTTGQINSFIFDKDGHRYEAFIQSGFGMNNNTTNIGEEERMFETKVQIKVLGYLMGEGYTRSRSVNARRENRAKIVITGERTMVGDKIPWKTKDNDYKD
tara:strand:- start:2869 stop:3717 length:849 start_codon:yes stop_codon:yes gene_type:complete